VCVCVNMLSDAAVVNCQ